MKLDKLTKAELLDLAAKKKITGRTKMTKPELIKALEPLYAGKTATNEKTPNSAQPGYEIKPQAPVKPKKDEYPIPEFYNKDTLVLLPVDPSREYVFWEISDVTYNNAKSKFLLSETKLLLKVFTSLDNTITESASVAVERFGNWYFNVYAPDMVIWSEIGLLDSNGAFHAILKSRQIKMPADKVSDIVDEETWMTIGGELERLYKLSGVGMQVHNSSITVHSEIVKQLTQHMTSSSGFAKDKSL